MHFKKVIFVLLVIGSILLSGCNQTDADVASKNLSLEADQFQIMRRIIFYNGVTGEYILAVEGFCSLGNNDTTGRLSVTCKTEDEKYVKHFLGLSDNVTFFAEQLSAEDVDTYRYKVIFKPSAIIPDVELKSP